MRDPWAAIEGDTTGQPLLLAQDPTKTEVDCSREIWENHVLARHPEVKELKDLIFTAIQSPAKQEVDTEDRRAIRYYADVPKERVESRHSLWLRVVVKYVYPTELGNERVGLVSSAYLVRKD